jgi:hypothetical protein
MYTGTKHKHVNDEEPAAPIFKVSKKKIIIKKKGWHKQGYVQTTENQSLKKRKNVFNEGK